MYACMYVCMYVVSMYVRRCVSMRVYIYTHTHVHVCTLYTHLLVHAFINLVAEMTDVNMSWIVRHKETSTLVVRIHTYTLTHVHRDRVDSRPSNALHKKGVQRILESGFTLPDILVTVNRLFCFGPTAPLTWDRWMKLLKISGS